MATPSITDHLGKDNVPNPNHQLFDKLIAEMEDYAIFLLDADGIVMSWNDGAERIKGYSADEIIGKSFKTFYTKADVEAGVPDKLLEKARKDGRVQDEGWRVGNYEDMFWARIVISAVHDEQGNVTGFIKVIRDLSERIAAEKIISEYEKSLTEQAQQAEKMRQMYYSFITEVVDYSIIMLDSSGHIIDWNKGAEQIKGYSADEIIGKHFSILYQEEDRKALLPETLLYKAKTEGRATHEGYRVKKDGTTFWGNITIKTLYDDRGKVKGYVKITKDLTDKMLSDRAIAEYAAELEKEIARVREKDEVIDTRGKKLDRSTLVREHFQKALHMGMQQPMNDIVNAVKQISDLLEDQNSAKVTKELDKIKASAYHSRKQLKDLSLLGTILEDKVDVKPVEFDLKALVEMINAKIILESNSSNNIDFTYSGDAMTTLPINTTQYIIENLISNAIKHTPHKALIDITCNNEHDRILLRVEDHGLGIPSSEIDKIYDCFFRGSNSEHMQGAGISLFIVKSYIDQMGGEISCLSSPEEGTIFTVTLPIRPIAAS